MRILGVVIGLVLIGVAIAAMLLVDGRRVPPERAAIVRPVRTMIVGERAGTARQLPARVRATSEVTLSFQVSGVVQELPILRGQTIRRGDLLARIDQRDFNSRLTAARVQLGQLETELAAVTRAFEQEAATAIELARFQSSVDQARTSVEVAEKALEDTSLLAPFDGVVADVFIDQFQKVSVGLPIVRLQGRDAVRVEVNVDPTRVALAREAGEDVTYAVRFDFLPEREFEARLVEFTSEANPRTQTFLAIMEMIAPENILILPGMPATLVERRAPRATTALRVPMEAVLTDAEGDTFVWRVTPQQDDLALVNRAPVSLGAPHDGSVEIIYGLSPGERIVVAGARELAEGQRVRPDGVAASALNDEHDPESAGGER